MSGTRRLASRKLCLSLLIPWSNSSVPWSDANMMLHAPADLTKSVRVQQPTAARTTNEKMSRSCLESFAQSLVTEVPLVHKVQQASNLVVHIIRLCVVVVAPVWMRRSSRSRLIDKRHVRLSPVTICQNRSRIVCVLFGHTTAFGNAGGSLCSLPSRPRSIRVWNGSSAMSPAL